MKTAQKLLAEKDLYLDEMPMLHKALEKFCTSLDLDTWGSGAENWVSELQCRRADGFIPHGHNHGGFDAYNTLESVSNVDNDDEDSSIVMHGFRFMYEGKDLEDNHVLCAYYCQWDEDDCYGINRAPTISQIEITFKTPVQLFKKLNKFTSKTLKGASK